MAAATVHGRGARGYVVAASFPDLGHRLRTRRARPPHRGIKVRDVSGFGLTRQSSPLGCSRRRHSPMARS